MQGDVAAMASICLVKVVRYESVCVPFFLTGVSLACSLGGASVCFEWQGRSRTLLLNLDVPGDME